MSKFIIFGDDIINEEVRMLDEQLHLRDLRDGGQDHRTPTERMRELQREAFELLLNRYAGRGLVYHSHTNYGYVFVARDYPARPGDHSENG